MPSIHTEQATTTNAFVGTAVRNMANCGKLTVGRVIKRAAGPIANRHVVLLRPAPFAMASAGSLREISCESATHCPRHLAYDHRPPVIDRVNQGPSSGRAPSGPGIPTT
jgi:hypothetical protein